MTDKNKNKSLELYKNDVITFLNNHRYNENKHDKPTHQSWGNIIQGKFYILDDIKEFMEIYCNAINNNIYDFSILEIQKEYSPIIIDIDLKLPIENYTPKTRLYDNELILNIINKFITIMDIYLNYNKNDINICVFEKNIVELDDICKDGIHIMFPDICADINLRHLIRHKVVELCNKDGLFQIYLDTADKIIDKAVVSSNGWFLYGSKKPGGQNYKLTQVYNGLLEKIDLQTDIIKYLSIHYKKNRYSKKSNFIK